MTRQILLDLDGVLVDLHPEVLRLHGHVFDEARVPAGEWLISKWVGLDEETVWKHPDLHSFDFWANLPKTPWFDELMAMVTAYFPVELQCILTKSATTATAGGKQAWIERHLPKHHYLIGGGKHFVASPNKILLDDADHNVDAFRAHGGQAILFPRRWNRNNGLWERKLESVHGQLQQLAHQAGV